MTIKGSFILEHPHVKAVFGCKKNRSDMFRRTLRKYPSRGVGCSLIEEPPKNEHTIVTPKARQNHVSGEQKPLNRSIQNFACRVPSMT